MKLIHTADLHLESKMESNLSKDQATQRRSELLETFERLTLFADKNGVEAILISGDTFDKSNVRKTAMRRILDSICAFPHIKFFFLRGNHDCEAFEEEIVSEKRDNLFFFETGKWNSYDLGENIVITGREINDDNQNSIYSDLVLDVGKCNIVMLHGQESMYDGRDKTHIINIKSLQNKYIDYLALGHVHKYKSEKLDERGTYCYPGCPEPRGFDECGQKGFVLLDIEDKVINTEFIPFQTREFHEIEIEIKPDMDLRTVYETVENGIAGISTEDLVKLIITGRTDIERDIDSDRICERYADRFYFLKVYDKTRAKIDYEGFVYDRSLKGSFVRLVSGLDIPEERKADIIETGIRAIMGEEINQ